MKAPLRELACTAIVVCFAVAGCGDTGRERLTVEAFARGKKARNIDIDGATLRLTEAEVAFGPLYLCATESADVDLCETALAELLSTRTCDALSPQAQALGSLSATTGSVRSGLFDYGISWTLTREGAQPSEDSADGHSARLAGTITLDDGPTLRFRADIDAEPLSAGDAAVNGLKARHELTRRSKSMTVQFDPSAWLQRIKLDRVLEIDPDEGGELRFEPGSQPYEAILQAMTANEPPVLLWNEN